MGNSVKWISNPQRPDNCTSQAARMLGACSLGAQILSFAKVRSWDELNGQMPSMLRLTDTQAALVSEFEYLCAMQKAKTKPDDDSEPLPRVTVIVCSECERWTLFATGATKTSKCALTIGCTGKLLSPPSTKRVSEPPEPLDLSVAAPTIEPESQPEVEPAVPVTEPEPEPAPPPADDVLDSPWGYY